MRRRAASGLGATGRKGRGTVMKSRGDITVSGVVMKEWQRTPKQLLHEWTQKQKRPRPQYQTRPAKPASHHRVSAYLLDKKNKERSLRATPDHVVPYRAPGSACSCAHVTERHRPRFHTSASSPSRSAPCGSSLSVARESKKSK